MKSFTAVAALLALLPTAFSLTINTPLSVVECQPVLFSWTDGTAPYFLSLIPGGQPSGTPLQQFPSSTTTSFTWTANIQSGTSVTAEIRDSTGAIAYTDAFTVQAGSDSACLTASPSGSTTAAAGASSGATAATTTGSAGASGSAAASGKTTASGSASAATSSNSASAASRGSSVSAFGAAGLMGLIGAALAL